MPEETETKDEALVEFFVNPAILSAECDDVSWTDHDRSWRNQYAIWEHGNELVSSSTASQQDLETGIIQLQRAVEHRDKLLDRLYSFEMIPGKPGAKYVTMADLKIIRPGLKVRLRELRNKLMHDLDEIFLNQADCAELSDTAWYYLKATDHLSQQCAIDLRLHYVDGDEHYYFGFDFNRTDWAVTINAYLPSSLLLESRIADCLTVVANEGSIRTIGNGISLEGNATGTPSALYKLVRIFFEESALR